MAAPTSPPTVNPYLKITVIVLGVLIVGAIVAIGIGIYQKSKRASGLPAAEAVRVASAPLVPDGTTQADNWSSPETSLGLPQGSHVVEMTANGDRLILNVRVPGEGEQIVIVDLVKGQVIGNVALERQR
jgi:hypothetical protein